jgi:small subunit ribosomal protein S21
MGLSYPVSLKSPFPQRFPRKSAATMDRRWRFCYLAAFARKRTGRRKARCRAVCAFKFVGRRALVQIFVRDNNVDQALKALKKKMQREGTFREMKRRNHYEKPSEKRARERAEAVRRARKLARKRAQREGLLPRPASKR